MTKVISEIVFRLETVRAKKKGIVHKQYILVVKVVYHADI